MAVTEMREYHDDMRVVFTRRPDGTSEQRPYTEAENAEADKKSKKAARKTTADTDTRTAITQLEAIVAKAPNKIDVADTKLVAEQVLRISRLLLDAFD